jgi:hypothetical protein
MRKLMEPTLRTDQSVGLSSCLAEMTRVDSNSGDLALCTFGTGHPHEMMAGLVPSQGHDSVFGLRPRRA